MQVHSIKTSAALYYVVKDGSKTFDVRNDDRAYQKGDIIGLYVPPEPPTMPGNQPASISLYPPIYYKVGFVLRGGQYGLQPGYVAFSLVPLEPAEKAELDRLTALPVGLVPGPLVPGAPPVPQPPAPARYVPPAPMVKADDFAEQMEDELNAAAAVQAKPDRGGMSQHPKR